jgi:hypothetical protein
VTNLVAVTPNPHEKIIGLDISVNKIFRMNVFHSPDHLIRKHQNSLDGEPSRAKIE